MLQGEVSLVYVCVHVQTSIHMYKKTLIRHFPTCYAYSVKSLYLERALDEDTVPGVFLCTSFTACKLCLVFALILF